MGLTLNARSQSGIPSAGLEKNPQHICQPDEGFDVIRIRLEGALKKVDLRFSIAPPPSNETEHVESPHVLRISSNDGVAKGFCLVQATRSICGDRLI